MNKTRSTTIDSSSVNSPRIIDPLISARARFFLEITRMVISDTKNPIQAMRSNMEAKADLSSNNRTADSSGKLGIFRGLRFRIQTVKYPEIWPI